ncbi:hypothetical protein BD414DRAFT_129391 [Trametes punicea]|nr:hypothetical protein BD414DRAFT_129391 [Trametes punicea]
MQLSRRQSVSSHMTADEEDVIEIVYSDPPSLTVRSGACYVSLPPLPAYVPERKRPSSPSLEPSQPSSKKPRAAHVDDPEDDGHAVTAEVQIRRPKISRAVRPYLVSTRPSRPNPSMQSSADEDSRQASPIDEANVTALALADAIGRANRQPPIFTKKPLHPRKRNRVIESDSEESSYPPRPNNVLARSRSEASTSRVPGLIMMTTPEAAASQGIELEPTSRNVVRPLPRTQVLKRPRMEAPPSSDGQASLDVLPLNTASKGSVVAINGPVAKKRKGPPGLTHEEMEKRLEAEERKRKEQEPRTVPRARKVAQPKGQPTTIEKPHRENILHKPTPSRSQTEAASGNETRSADAVANEEVPSNVSRVMPAPATTIDGASTQIPASPITSVAPSARTAEALQVGHSTMTISASSGSAYIPAPVSVHAPAPVPIHVAAAVPDGVAASTLGQVPPFASVRPSPAAEQDQRLSHSVPLVRVLNAADSADVSVRHLCDSLRHLVSGALRDEERQQHFEQKLNALQDVVREICQSRGRMEEELNVMKGSLGAIEDHCHRLQDDYRKEREERSMMAATIRAMEKELRAGQLACQHQSAAFGPQHHDIVRELAREVVNSTLRPQGLPAPGPLPSMPYVHDFQHVCPLFLCCSVLC